MRLGCSSMMYCGQISFSFQKSLGFNLRSLEEIFSLVITSLAPGVACQSYISLHTFLTQIQTYIKAQEEKKHFKYDRFSEVHA